MKKLYRTWSSHQFAISTMTIASALLLATSAHAQQASPTSAFDEAFEQSAQASSDVAIPTADVQRMLVYSAVTALNQANLTNDYSVVVKLGSQPFQQLNSEQFLAEQFASFRANNIDLSPALLYQPLWNGSPSIEQNAVRLRGVFDTSPQQVQFDLAFVLENGRWRIAGLSVGLSAPRSGG